MSSGSGQRREAVRGVSPEVKRRRRAALTLAAALLRRGAACWLPRLRHGSMTALASGIGGMCFVEDTLPTDVDSRVPIEVVCTA